jgi:hypothetical protein
MILWILIPIEIQIQLCDITLLHPILAEIQIQLYDKMPEIIPYEILMCFYDTGHDIMKLEIINFI